MTASGHWSQTHPWLCATVPSIRVQNSSSCGTEAVTTPGPPPSIRLPSLHRRHLLYTRGHAQRVRLCVPGSPSTAAPGSSHRTVHRPVARSQSCPGNTTRQLWGIPVAPKRRPTPECSPPRRPASGKHTRGLCFRTRVLPALATSAGSYTLGADDDAEGSERLEPGVYHKAPGTSFHPPRCALSGNHSPENASHLASREKA